MRTRDRLSASRLERSSDARDKLTIALSRAGRDSERHWFFSRVMRLGLAVTGAVSLTVLINFASVSPVAEGDSVLTHLAPALIGAILTGTVFILVDRTFRRELREDAARGLNDVQVLTRYENAIELLAARDLPSRQAGVFSLKTLASNSSELTAPVISVLTSFVAEKVGRGKRESWGLAPEEIDSNFKDVVSALRVISSLNCSGTRINLRNVDLSSFDLSDLNFSGTDFTGAIFDYANVSLSIFDGCNLRGAGFRGATAIEASFFRAVLHNADLTKALLASTNFSGSLMSSARLEGVVATKCNFSGALLGEANLALANLKGSDFEDSYLHGADLSDTDLREVQLSGAKLNNNRISGALISEDQRRLFQQGSADDLPGGASRAS